MGGIINAWWQVLACEPALRVFDNQPPRPYPINPLRLHFAMVLFRAVS